MIRSDQKRLAEGNGLVVSEVADLSDLASQIARQGDKKIYPLLRELARTAPANTAIVEIGSWFGAGTAHLALGIRERPCPGDITLHCYDRWQASRREVAKKAKFPGAKLKVGNDILPHVRRTLEPFGVPIQFQKGELLSASWSGTPISVYVDDASKSPELFVHALDTFLPSWIPGSTRVVLMDFDYLEKLGTYEHQCQKLFSATAVASSAWVMLAPSA